MVMNTEKECDKAYRDYSEGFFGAPWDHRLNDDEWREVRHSRREIPENTYADQMEKGVKSRRLSSVKVSGMLFP